jgi:hypothetical protein
MIMEEYEREKELEAAARIPEANLCHLRSPWAHSAHPVDEWVSHPAEGPEEE